MAELTLATLAAQAFTGLVLGMILVLLAIGLSLIFGLMTVVNFAHGALYMLGAYFGVFLLGLTKNFWLSRSEEHTSELQSRLHLVCRLLLEKKKKKYRS